MTNRVPVLAQVRRKHLVHSIVYRYFNTIDVNNYFSLLNFATSKFDVLQLARVSVLRSCFIQLS